MKDLKAFITELAGSEALKTGLAEALKDRKLPEFLKENDCDADPAELVAILRKAVAPKEDESMSADEMDTVAGGISGAPLFMPQIPIFRPWETKNVIIQDNDINGLSGNLELFENLDFDFIIQEGTSK